MSRGALEELFDGFLVEHSSVDGPVVQFTKCERSRQRQTTVAAAERAIRKKREDEGRYFVRKIGISLTSEGGDLRTLHGIEQSELRLDDTGLRLRASEFRADRAMQFDEILNGEITDAAVSL